MTVNTTVAQPAAPETALALKRRGRGRAKALTMIAVKCDDRQWGDFRDAVYPLLLRYGFFDPMTDGPSNGSVASRRPPSPSLGEPCERG